MLGLAEIVTVMGAVFILEVFWIEIEIASYASENKPTKTNG